MAQKVVRKDNYDDFLFYFKGLRLTEGAESFICLILKENRTLAEKLLLDTQLNTVDLKLIWLIRAIFGKELFTPEVIQNIKTVTPYNSTESALGWEKLLPMDTLVLISAIFWYLNKTQTFLYIYEVSYLLLILKFLRGEFSND